MANMTPEDFPILCETCLGENPYLRMTREKYGKACKICDRAFTVYRWRPGKNSRFKKTEICLTCSRLKNVCQTCILDLQYGLPVQVRDTALEEHEKMEMPVSRTNRDYLYEQLEEGVGVGRDGASALNLPYDRLTTSHRKETAMLERLQRRGPYYRRNLPHICSFFVKGECNRGAACPYRHEMPTTGELADQNIKDRFYGVNDPVAKKLLRKNDEMKEADNRLALQGPPKDPADPNVRTLFVGGVDSSVTEEHLREAFQAYGTVTNIHVVPEKKCGFVTFSQRSAAKLAIGSLYNVLVVVGKRLKLDWGRSSSSTSLNGYTSTYVQQSGPPSGMESRALPGPVVASNLPPPPGMSTSLATARAKVAFSKDEEEYLRSQGVVRPAMPALTDPVNLPPPPGMGPPTAHNQSQGQYRAMQSTYGEAYFNSRD